MQKLQKGSKVTRIKRDRDKFCKNQLWRHIYGDICFIRKQSILVRVQYMESTGTVYGEIIEESTLFKIGILNKIA